MVGVLVVTAVVVGPAVSRRLGWSGAEPSYQLTYEDVKKVLEGQSAALLAGRERDWLTLVDPQAPAVVDRYRQLYASLRAVGVSLFEQSPVFEDGPDPDGTAQILIYADVCLANPICNRRDRPYGELGER